ncbi:MAG: hypothetical protein QOF14_3698 [Hyphomicrobiales bacterium]|jgi:molecular chaperone HscA|nr:hypothetical protein [Hyphomicrobiales bacterium]
MDREVARVLIESLLQRLSRDQTHFHLPDGRLSENEVVALRILAGIPEPKSHEQAPPTPPAPKLDLAALSRPAMPPDQIRLCLDFGTAMSKAWASGAMLENTFPLVLGRPADGIDILAAPSSIFITGTGHMYFGAAAERQHESEIHLGRHRFDNIKRLLSEVEPGLDLDEVPLEAGIDPTSSGLTKGDLVVLYLGWLTDMALKALQATVEDQAPDLLKTYSDLRAIRRRFAIPCFEHAVDDVPSSVRAEWAEKVMESALIRAQVVADTFSGRWNSLTASEARAVLQAVRATNLTALTLFCSPHSVREPVAAGATRFEDHIAGQETTTGTARRLMLVVDAGAGTTDFALFQSFSKAGSDETTFALIANAVRMSRIAGNRVDAVLRPLILRACKVHPENGSPWNEEEFSIIKADLSSQIRSLKQQLFAAGSVSISLRPGASGVLTLKDLEDDPTYQELGRNLMGQRDELFAKALSEESLEGFKAIISRVGRPIPIYVLLTGGSARLPVVQAIANGTMSIGGVKFEFKLITDPPRWIVELPRELSELTAREFAQCAVAIGGSAPELPKEQSDLMAPVTPPRQGVRTLPRFQVTGT